MNNEGTKGSKKVKENEITIKNEIINQKGLVD